MSSISTWSLTAANNNSIAPNGFPEGMNPSDVNNSAREVMAAVRAYCEAGGFFDYGHTITNVDATTFRVSNGDGDQSTLYTVGRRVKLTDSSTLTGEIISVSYLGGTGTDVGVELDSGAISASISAAMLGPDPLSASQVIPAFVGEVRTGYFNTAPDGWILADDGSIGSTASGATTRANIDTEDLYTLFWDNVSDTYAPVATGRGASAAADFAANKALTMPPVLGRALGVVGAGASLTTRTLGETDGAETHTLTIAQLAAHTHTHTRYGSVVDDAPTAGGAGANLLNSTVGTTSSVGSSDPHNNMQPTTFVTAIIKL